MSVSKKSIPVALIDIGSGQVAVAHALVHRGKDTHERPSIIAEQTLDIPLMEEITIDRFISESAKVLGNAIEKLQKSDLHRPEFIQVTLAAPWVVSQTRQIEYKKTTPFVCTQKLVDELVEKEIQFVREHDMERFGSYGKDGVLVEKQLSHIALNGYSTVNPFGRKALELSIHLTVTVMPQIVMTQFNEVIRRYYGTRNIGFASRMYSSYIVIRDFYLPKSDTWIVDFGSEITDIGFVKNGFLLYHHTFPIGSNHLYKTLSQKSPHTTQEAKALIETYRLGKTGTIGEGVIQATVGTFIEHWTTKLHEVFDTGQFGFCAPDACFIMGDDRFAGLLPEAISQDTFLQHFCTTNAAVPIFLTTEELRTTLGITTENQNALLLIDSLFVERIL